MLPHGRLLQVGRISLELGGEAALLGRTWGAVGPNGGAGGQRGGLRRALVLRGRQRQTGRAVGVRREAVVGRQLAGIQGDPLRAERGAERGSAGAHPPLKPPSTPPHPQHRAGRGGVEEERGNGGGEGMGVGVSALG